MKEYSMVVTLLAALLATHGIAGEEKSSEPVLSAGPGKSIVGRTLPPGTYRVVPELSPGQREAFVRVTLVADDSVKPHDAVPPATGAAVDPVATDIPPAKPQKDPPGDAPDAEPSDTPPAQPQPQPAQAPKQTEPSGTGPDYDCEFGLPRRDGGHGELELTPGDLPAGFHLDDFANFNKACEVHQWIMHGPDRRNRVELSISPWGPRAEKYYDWKHGMLGTGEFEHTDLSLGTKELYVEQKAECNKQLIMQAGNYLVEMHRPSVEGVPQQADPISRQKFVALAKACEARIAAVAGIPDKAMLDNNPAEFRWKNIVWPASFANGTLKVQGAGLNKWGTQWVIVDTGIQSYRGQGTGAGPVVSYTKDGKRWTIVTLGHETGASGNVRAFDTRVSILKAGEHGATLRIGGTCYDYSWNHLEEIDCQTGQFIHASKGKQNAGVEEPGKVPQPPAGEQPGTQAKPEVPPGVPPPTSAPLPPWADLPDWARNLDLEMSAGNPPEVFNKYGDWYWIFDYGEAVSLKMTDRGTGRNIPTVFSVWRPDGWRQDGFDGEIEPASGEVYDAIKPGPGMFHTERITLTYVPKGGTRPQTKTLDRCRTSDEQTSLPWRFHVNPPLKVGLEWPDDQMEALTWSSVLSSDSGTPIEGVRVTIQGENTPAFDLDPSFSFGRLYQVTYLELRRANIPRGIYTVYAYKRDENLAKDLWAAEEYKIAIPPAKGTTWKLRIFMTETGKKWNKYNLGELDQKLNQ